MTVTMRAEWKYGLYGFVSLRFDKYYYKIIPEWVKKEILNYAEIDRTSMNLSPFLITDDVREHIIESLENNGIEINDRMINVWNDIFPMDDAYYPWEFSAAYLTYDEMEKYFHIFMDSDKFKENTITPKSYTLDSYIHEILDIAGEYALFWIGESTILVNSNIYGKLDNIPIFDGMTFNKQDNGIYISWVRK